MSYGSRSTTFIVIPQPPGYCFVYFVVFMFAVNTLATSFENCLTDDVLFLDVKFGYLQNVILSDL